MLEERALEIVQNQIKAPLEIVGAGSQNQSKWRPIKMMTALAIACTQGLESKKKMPDEHNQKSVLNSI